jgi:hypothetical protein
MVEHFYIMYLLYILNHLGIITFHAAQPALSIHPLLHYVLSGRKGQFHGSGAGLVVISYWLAQVGATPSRNIANLSALASPYNQKKSSLLDWQLIG